MKIGGNTFRGEASRVDPSLLQPNMAQKAVNCDMRSGKLHPIKTNERVSPAVTISEGTKTIFPWGTDNEGWLTFLKDANCVKTPIENDQYERLYITEEGEVPKFMANDEAEAMPIAFEAPGVAPSVTSSVYSSTISTLGSAGGQIPPLPIVPDDGNDVQIKVMWYYETTAGVITEGGNIPLSAFPGFEACYVNEYYVRRAESEGLVWDKNCFVTEQNSYLGIGLISMLMPEGYPPPPSGEDASWTEIKYRLDIYSKGEFLGSIWESDSSYNGTDLADIGWLTPTMSKFVGTAENEYEYVNGTAIPYTDGYTYLGFNYDIDYVSASYYFTYVDKYSRESGPSESTGVGDFNASRKAVVTFSDTPPDNAVYRRLYRAVTSDAGTEFQFVEDIPVAVTTYSDIKPAGKLGETCPAELWEPPPDDLVGLVALPGEILAGFTGQTIRYSEQSQPHAWPSIYSDTVDGNIVALAVSGNTLVVLTDDKNVLITVAAPGNTSAYVIPANQACSSKRGAWETGGAVLYPSPDGLQSIAGSTITNITKRLITKEQWAAWVPSTMIICSYDDVIYVFSETGEVIALAYDEIQNGFTTQTLLVDGVYLDTVADTLYVLSGDELYKFRQGDANEMIDWTGPETAIDRRMAFGFVRVLADNYPVEVAMIANETNEACRLEINGEGTRRLPIMRKERSWAINVRSNYAINSVQVATSMKELL